MMAYFRLCPPRSRLVAHRYMPCVRVWFRTDAPAQHLNAPL
ncbi:hypothetical protein SAMN05216268_111308 [Streptomyces yunnanensis]|uniref:Uncharacterized protein n=1 Tax=Streptomyces yunnanensis TaxID=156453 RepID=A0A9X8N0I0_9ACTN|nr:hypothetical protein SAMN05216268_111308 [Streptomyces yunnanensis]